MDHSEYRLLLLIAFLGAICLGLKGLINKMPEIDIESLEKNISVQSKIHFAKDSYTCRAGDHIDTTITTDPDDLLKSFKTNNFFIVRIKKNPGYTLKCLNCTAVRIYCKKAGNGSVSATTRSGVKVTVPVTVIKKNTHTIAISKESIDCIKGQTVSARITASGIVNNKANSIKSYYIDDTNVATVTDSVNQPKCIGCRNVDIKCKNTGKTTLRAVSTMGDKASSIVTVAAATHKITISNTDIKCEKGQVIKTEIKATGIVNNKVNGIKSVTVANPKIATITDSSIQPKCFGCRYKNVKCLSEGTTTIKAVSTMGDSASAKVTVGKGTVGYAKSVYACSKGQTFFTTITASGSLTGIKTFSSDDIAIATIAFSNAQPKCPNCIGVDVTCRGNGSTYLRATSRTGAVTKSVIKVRAASKKDITKKSS